MNIEWAEKEHKTRTFLMFAGLTVYYLLFFVLKIYSKHGDTFGTLPLIAVTALYMSLAFIIFHKNTLSLKTNHVLSAAGFAITPILSYFSVELILHGILGTDIPLEPDIVLLNCGIYALFMLFVYMLSCSFKWASVITYIFDIGMGLAMFLVLDERNTALIAEDFLSIGTAGNVVSDGLYPLNLFFSSFAGISIAYAGIIVMSRLVCPKAPAKRYRAGVMILSVIPIFLFAWIYVSSPILDSYTSELYLPQKAYARCGSMFALAESTKDTEVVKPEGYSKAAAEKIAADYKSDDITAESSGKKKKANIIVIMNESFCDLQSAGNGFTTNKDVMPFVRSMKNNTIKGNMYVSGFGGGTAIMEFEFLTGCSNAFLPESNIAYQTEIKSDMPSMADRLKKLGYTGITAIHPFSGSGYKRDKAYPLLGFDKFLTQDDFTSSADKKKVGSLISDESAYNKIIEEYSASKKKTSKPYFAFEVTIQNHSPYRSFDQGIRITDKKINSDNTEKYLNYIHESDKAIKYLVDYFENKKDPTVIAFFGDHPPAISGDIYDQILGKKLIDTDMAENIELRKTPFFIWANYDIKEESGVDMSTSYFSDLVEKTAGISSRTGYQKFLSDFREKVPVINAFGYRAANGKYYRIDDKTSPYYKLVWKYSILQYNDLIDTDNRISGFFS